MIFFCVFEVFLLNFWASFGLFFEVKIDFWGLISAKISEISPPFGRNISIGWRRYLCEVVEISRHSRWRYLHHVVGISPPRRGDISNGVQFCRKIDKKRRRLFLIAAQCHKALWYGCRGLSRKTAATASCVAPVVGVEIVVAIGLVRCVAEFGFANLFVEFTLGIHQFEYAFQWFGSFV